jgi:hypothetical protein
MVTFVINGALLYRISAPEITVLRQRRQGALSFYPDKPSSFAGREWGKMVLKWPKMMD